MKWNQRKEAALVALFPALIMTFIIGVTVGSKTDDLQGFLVILPFATIAFWVCFYGVWRSLDGHFDTLEGKHKPKTENKTKAKGVLRRWYESLDFG